jgi:hypothetical protein
MNCQQTQELLEDYTLGWLDPERQAQVESHLATCTDCGAIAAAYAESLATLPEALANASPYAVPKGLRDTIMARVLAAPAILPQDGHETPLGSPTAVVRPQPVATALHPWASSLPRLRLALVAACLLLVIVLLWSIRLNVVLARERALRAEFRELVDRQEIVLEVIDSSNTERRVLLPPEGSPDSGARPYGKVFTRSDMAHVVAMAARLTPPAPGQGYHLWLTRNGETFLAGTLRTNQEGFGLLVYDDSVDGPEYTRAAVTLQPLGSTTPVEPPVLEWRPAE